MLRIHRSLAGRIRKVDCGAVADSAEDYIEGFAVYKSYLKNVRGLVSPERLRKLIRKIDKMEREILNLENKIESVEERRARAACQLEDYLKNNLEIVVDCLEPDEYGEFLR